MEIFLGIRFSIVDYVSILGYGDLVYGNVTIKGVYYVARLGYSLFNIGQFCDNDLEVAFLKHICSIQSKGGKELLRGGRASNLYTIALPEIAKNYSVCLMATLTSSQAWLWHLLVSH